MKQEPVAWMDKYTNKCVVFINTPPSDNWIPLYTAPRELSDEEINTIREALLMIGFQDAFINYHLKEEALAILKKAREHE